ncbi:hypothetical protein LXA43DRAFT_896726, partial [Ganoderma leucocontextum]
RKFNHFHDLFVKMSGANMSADETDQDDKGAKKCPTSYTITRASWMSFALRKVCRDLNKENIGSRNTSTGNLGPGGNGPRTRADATPPREADTRAPEGLWHNCYSAGWLACLREHEVRKLNIIDEDFDLSIPTGDTSDEHKSDEEMEG